MSFADRLRAAVASDVAARQALGDPDPRVRRVALGRLVNGPDRAAALECARADADPFVRAAAIDAYGAGADGDPAVLLGALHDDHDLVAEAAALALGATGAPEAVPALVAAVRDHESDIVREAAAAALGELRDPRAIEPLLRAAEADRPPVRRRALLALSVFDDPRAKAAIAAAKVARNPAVREIAEQLAGGED